jgi:glycosyltransferase involved in cell wall biosynthesis
MNILVVADVLFPDTVGGAGRLASELSFALAERGHSVRIISRNPDGRLPGKETLKARVAVYRFAVKTRRWRLLPDELVSSTRTIRAATLHWTADIAVIHQSLPALGAMLAGYFREMPVTYFFHSPWHEEYLIKKRTGRAYPDAKNILAGGVMRRIEGTLIGRAGLVFVISDYMKKMAMNIHGLCDDRIRILPAGIDPVKFRLPAGGKDGARKKAGVSTGRTFFFTARNLVSRMGIENLVRGFGQSRTLREEGLLLIAGSGPLAGRLKRMIDTERLGDCVQLLGYVPEDRLIECYQAADFFVLPTSSLEGFGLVILEAMACGTPVVGTRIAAIPEILSPFDSRLLVDTADASAIRDRLEDIVRRRENYAFAPEVCRRFVTERYSWDKMAASFDQLVGSLVGQIRR